MTLSWICREYVYTYSQEINLNTTIMSQSIGPFLRTNWKMLSSKPMGKWLFSRLVGFIVPYTGSIGARVETLEPGHGVITLRDRRKVRNHLKSVHAVALVNLAEIATGMTLLNSLPDDTRGILTAIQIQYLKKARGLLSAECHCDIPQDNAQEELQISTDIKNDMGEIVASATATWLIGPEKR